jgi:hypothetical protein
MNQEQVPQEQGTAQTEILVEARGWLENIRVASFQIRSLNPNNSQTHREIDASFRDINFYSGALRGALAVYKASRVADPSVVSEMELYSRQAEELIESVTSQFRGQQ